MFTHPDLLYVLAKEHAADLTARAEQGRLLSLARRHRRSAVAARKAAAAEAAGAESQVRGRIVSGDQGSLSACDPRAA